MSYWFSTEKEREMQLRKKAHMHSILLYNRQMCEQKRRREKNNEQDLQKYGEKSSREMLNQLIEDNAKKRRRRDEERTILRESYERQMRQKHQKQLQQKRQQQIYYDRERQFLQYQEYKRVQEITKMLQRVTYKAVPLPLLPNNRRVKTQPNATDRNSYNPQPIHNINQPIFTLHPVPLTNQSPSNIKPSYINQPRISLNYLPNSTSSKQRSLSYHFNNYK